MRFETRLYIILLPIAFCLLVASCNPSPYYQHEEALPKNTWYAANKLSFKYDISDTNAYYVPYFLVRHTDAYPYKNIWVWMYVKEPDESYFHKFRLNIQLAEASGQWRGRSMGEIWEQRLLVTGLGDSISLRKSGPYEIVFEQNMRTDPLPEILNIGLRVEKIPARR